MGETTTVECIYCRDPLTAKTRWAHVWPASLGGRLKSRAVNCDDCNNAIGSIEDNSRASLLHAFAAVGATNDDRDPIAVSIEYAGREFVYADGNAAMQVAGAGSIERPRA